MSPFLRLSRPALGSLADALVANRIGFPVHAAALVNYVAEGLKQEIAIELNTLHQSGMSSNHIAYMLRLLSAERATAQAKHDRIELVWTGQEVMGSESRDTSVVVQELFSTAQHSVLISSFAIDKGSKARELFQVLANRMDANPNLQVRMFLNVQRPYGNRDSEATLLRQFAETFCKEIWCGSRLPEVFHDPRSLSLQSGPKACLHAKCIVVDEERLFITSANFTEAAHERNIEAGVLITDPVMARGVRSQFEMLVARDVLCESQEFRSV